MKLHANTHIVEKSGQFEESQFSIEASAKAFMILSDGLYSNKILAVIRELSTNAYDSHIDAGRGEKPFDVHLPTRLEPHFHVRDYGTSMTHEQCMTLYTTYFRSTRNNSNDAVGCLGLGSKAPFAYSDSFTVEAFLDGEKRVYAAHRDANGNPTFCLMDSVPTDEEDGIKVSLPVQINDIETFRKEARNVYEYFNVRPNINVDDIYYRDGNTLLGGEDGSWKFLDCCHSNAIVMGQICYPIDEDSIGTRYDDNDKIYDFLWQSAGLRLYANIGDVDITPSRESLSYTPQTKQNIRNLLQKVMDDIKDTVEDTIKSQPTLFLARKKYLEIEDQCGSVKSAMKSLHDAIMWNGQKIFDAMVGSKISVKNLGVKNLHKSGYRHKVDTTNDLQNINMRPNNQYFIDDLPRGGLGRIKQYLKEAYGADNYDAYIYKLPDSKTTDSNEFLTVLGDATLSDVILSSTLDKVEYNRSSGGGSTSQGYTMVYNHESNKLEEIPFSVKFENAVYIPMKKTRKLYKDDVAIINGREIRLPEVQKMIEYITDDLDCDMTFYFMTPSQVKTRNLDGRDNWHGPDYIIQKLSELGEHHRDRIEEVRNQQRKIDQTYESVFKLTSTDNKIKAIFAEYREYHDRVNRDFKKLDNIWAFVTNHTSVRFDRDDSTQDTYLNAYEAEISKYPMLPLVRYVSITNEQQLADYIDLVENSSKELTTIDR
jgi:hypothetical protein